MKSTSKKSFSECNLDQVTGIMNWEIWLTTWITISSCGIEP